MSKGLLSLGHRFESYKMPKNYMNLLLNHNLNKRFFAFCKKKKRPRLLKPLRKNVVRLILSFKKKLFWKKKQKKLYKKFSDYGVLRLIINRRNIFCTLSDLAGNMHASISSGLLKVKGRRRQAPHIVRATGQKIINQLFQHKKKKLILIHKGRAYKKKKKILLKTFTKVKKLKFVKVQRPVPRSHNGCRPPKIRRK